MRLLEQQPSQGMRGCLGICLITILSTPLHAATPPAAKREAKVTADAELAAAGVKLPPGFMISAVASEPLLENPVAFCFGPNGQIFVAETHRVGRGVEDNRHHMDWVDDDLAARTIEERRDYMIRRMGDRISQFTDTSELVRLLEDRDGDGRYDHSSVFSTGYDAIEAGAAAGVLWSGDRLLFTCIPALWELRDDDGDGQAEHKQPLATGFGVHIALYGHDLHGLTEGPDGKIYFSIGDRGLHVETKDGRVLSNPDSGAVLRCNPDGSGLELFATGLRNPQELAFNAFGDLFTVDNNSDSGDRARLVHVVEGMDAGWRMSYQYLPDRGPFNREKIWHTQTDDQPASIVPPLAHITDGPSGLVHYPGTGLPPEHNGAFFVCDFHGTPGTSGVRQFWLEPHGASYRLARDKMFAEGVLATDCDFGPDGALYVLDWIDGWSGTGKGRIHRVVSEDEPSKTERAATQAVLESIVRQDIDQLLAALGHADMRVRIAAQKRLAARGPTVASGLLQTAQSSATPLIARIHAVWAIGQLSEQNPEVLSRLSSLVHDEASEVRVQVARTLGRAAAAEDKALHERLSQRLVSMLDDESPRVRASAAIAVGKFNGGSEALSGLLNIAREANDDSTLRHAAAVGLAAIESETLIDAAESAGPLERLALVVALGRQKSDRVAEFLADELPRVHTEAARVIWDVPLPSAYDELAAALASVPSDNEAMLRRALAANLALRTPANLSAAIRCGLRDDLSPSMREHVWHLVRNWASPSLRDPVHGLWRPLKARPAEEAAATVAASLPMMAEAGPNGAAGLVVAAELGVAEAYQKMADLIADERQPAELRARAVAALATAAKPLAVAAIEAAMQSSDAVIRSAALQLMLQRFPEQAAAKVIEVAESGATREQQAAILMLAKLDAPAARKALAKWLARLERGECPPELVLEVIEAGLSSTNTSIVARAKAYQAELLESEDPLEKFTASLHGGNAEAGRRVFEENVSFACRRCHSLSPGESLVGPSLADVGLRLSRQELLSSIVTPNEKFAEGFQTTVLQLSTGKVVAGILRSEDGARAVLVDAEGKEIVVDVAEIEDRFEGLSAMPEDLVKQMTSRQLRDLVEWLSQQRVVAPSHGAAGKQ